ncbi:hypothetical protein OR221_0534 [Microbacterium laevaniformans OR221]|nr:hypothetical protein OR221_0534 [Microbacterium laevaniformans OR221]
MTSPRSVLTLVGGPTAIIEYAGIRVLTDPTFDEPGDYPSGTVALHKLTGPARPGRPTRSARSTSCCSHTTSIPTTWMPRVARSCLAPQP